MKEWEARQGDAALLLCRDAEKGVDKKKQPKLPAPPAADKAPTEDEESYEQAPRHKAAETVKERERADLLPVKVNGELVYRRDAKTDDQALPPVSTSLCSILYSPQGMLRGFRRIPSALHVVNRLLYMACRAFLGLLVWAIVDC